MLTKTFLSYYARIILLKGLSYVYTNSDFCVVLSGTGDTDKIDSNSVARHENHSSCKQTFTF
jgi:hypothetical protein